MLDFLVIFGTIVLFFIIGAAVILGLCLLVKAIGGVLGAVAVVITLSFLLALLIWLQDEDII